MSRRLPSSTVPLCLVGVLLLLLIVAWGPFANGETTAPRGAWSQTGDLAHERASHTATRLADDTVLVVGGSGSVTETERYAPDTGEWSLSGSLRTARQGHTATLLEDGRVLVAGGGTPMPIFSGSTLPLSTAELYDPVTETWSDAQPMKTARIGHMATRLDGPECDGEGRPAWCGQVLVAGVPFTVDGSDPAELYDPETDSWSSCPDVLADATCPGATGHPQVNGTATLMPDGGVLLSGRESGQSPASSDSSELYDPDTGIFSSCPEGEEEAGCPGPMDTHRLGGAAATALGDDRVLVAGGRVSSSLESPSAEVFDPEEGTWAQAAPMGQGRRLHTVTLLPDGSVLAAGGTGGSDAEGDEAERYLPGSNTWERAQPMYHPRDRHTATELPDGSVLVVGGGFGDALTSAERYELNEVPVGEVSGQVTDAGSGQALVGAEITAVDAGEEIAGTAETDGDGAYVVSDLEAGEYTVTAEADGHESASKSGVQVLARETTDVDFVLDAEEGQSGGVAGTVTDGDDPVEGATVAATPAGESEAAGTAETGADGGYEVSGLEAGDYTVSVDADGYQSASESGVQVSSGATTEGIDFALTAEETEESAKAWTPQDSGSAADFNAVEFVDAKRGWAVGTDATIVATTDRGETWQEQFACLSGSGCTASSSDRVSGLELYDVDFVDGQHGWAVGEAGIVLATDDGGQTWETRVAPSSNEFGRHGLFGVSFADQERGHAVSGFFGPGSIQATVDGGNVWLPRFSGVHVEDFYGVEFTGVDRGWVVGRNGTIVATDDGGLTWDMQRGGIFSDGGRDLYDVSFSFGSGWAVGENGRVVATGDGGDTWTIQETDTSESLSGVSFVDADHGWAVGSGGTVLATVDGGDNWGAQNSGTDISLNGVSFVDADRGWAVGDGGTILATAVGGYDAFGTVGGRVTAAESGEPLAGADVTVVTEAEEAAGTAETNGEGAYEVSDLEPGEYTVTADADGYEPASESGVQVEAGKTTEGVDFVLDAGESAPGGVAGTVTDGDGPVAGATVAATREGDGEAAGAVETGADGGYEVSGLEPGQYTVSVDADGYEPASQSGVTVSSGATTEGVDFALTAADAGDASVSGRVADAGGAAIEGARVAVVDGDDEVGDAGTGPDGAYTVEGLEAGTYDVTAEADGYESATESDVGVGEGEHVEGVDFALEAADAGDASVSGRVADAGGAAIEGARVAVVDGDDEVGDAGTGPDGAYTVEGLEAGTYDVTAEADGYESATESDVELGEEEDVEGIDFALELVPSGWTERDSGTTEDLRGVAFADPETGFVVGRQGTILTTSDGGRTWKHRSGPTSNDLNAVAVVDGATAVAVGDGGTILRTTDGGSTWKLRDSGVDADLNDVTFVDADHGWAVGEDGTILATSDGGDKEWTPQDSDTDDDLYGVSAVAAAPSADSVTAFATGYSGTMTTTTDGGESSWTSGSLPAGTLRDVEMTDAKRAYAVGEWVWVTTDGGETWQSQRDERSEGQGVACPDAQHCRIGGESVLTTFDGGDSYREEELTSDVAAIAVPDRTHATAVGDNGTIVSGRFTQVTGQVRDADSGEPVVATLVRVTEGAGPPVASTQTDGEGAYELGHYLDSGEYTVTADADGYEPASVERTVMSGATTAVEFVLEAEPGEGPDPGGRQAGTWSDGGGLPIGHTSSGTASLLADGEALLVGGFDHPHGAALWDPETRETRLTEPLETGRIHHTATRLDDGTVLVVGGRAPHLSTIPSTPVSDPRDRFSPLPTAELYDPEAQEWTTVDSMARARSHHSATALDDGRVLVAGGIGESQGLSFTVGSIGGSLGGAEFHGSVEIFDPETRTWTAPAPMELPRAHHTATVLDDGRVLVAGGETDREHLEAVGQRVPGGQAVTDSAELYDPAADVWRLCPPDAPVVGGADADCPGSMGTARFAHTATLLDDGGVLVTGGGLSDGGDTDTAEVYHPDTGTWKAVPEMDDSARGHTASPLDDGTVLVVRGSQAERYDPEDGEWWQAANAGANRTDHTATGLDNGHVLVAGGFGADVATAEVYSPVTRARPVVTSVDPARGPSRGGFAVTIRGGALADTVFVDFGRQRSGEVVERSHGQVTIVAPTHPRGREPLTVTTPGGTSEPTAAGAFTFFATDGRWQPGAQDLASPRTDVGTAVLDGPACDVGSPPDYCDQVLLVSGQTSRLFDPASEELGPEVDLPSGGLAYSLGASSRTTLLDGPACRGDDSPDYCGRVLALDGGGSGDVVLYDPSDGPNGSWQGCFGEAGDSACPARVPDGDVHRVALLDGPECRDNESVGDHCGKVVAATDVSGEAPAMWLYDPATGEWESAPSPSEERDDYAMTLVDGDACESDDPPAACGNVLITGGTKVVQDVSRLRSKTVGATTAELFDPAANQWRETDQAPRVGRGHASATSTPDGRVVVAGGTIAGSSSLLSDRAEAFDPVGESWQRLARLPEPRARHSAVVLPDGRVMLAGGLIKTAGEASQASTHSVVAWRADGSERGEWSYADSMADGRQMDSRGVDGFPLVTLADGRVLVAGGRGKTDDLTSVELYTAATAVRGEVTDADSGKAVVGATVSVTDGDDSEVATAGTDDAGGYEVDGLPPGSYTLTVSAPRYETDTRSVTLRSGEVATVDFLLQPDPDAFPGEIVGVVTDAESGDPVPGARVTVTDDGGEVVVSAGSDDEGRYAVRGLEAGAYLLTVDVPGYGSASREVDVPGGEVVTADFALRPADQVGRLEGVITDAESGDPIAGVRVGLVDGSGERVVTARTDEDGAYWVSHLRPDTYTLTAELDGYESASDEITVDAGETVTGDLTLTPTGTVAPLAQGATGVSRVAGANRFETAARLSAHAYPDGADVAYVATGFEFADALTGGVLAALEEGPVLLAGTSMVPEATAAELDRLDVSRVTLLGGPGALDRQVEAALGAHAESVGRLAGPSRFHTATEISQAAFPNGADTVYVATGGDFPDALAAVPVAADGDAPLLLATPGELTEPTESELARLDPDRIVLLGGTEALGEPVASTAGEFANTVDRLHGPTRFHTAAVVAAEGFPEADRVFVATGFDFPDAVAGGAIAGTYATPMVLSARDDLLDPTRQTLISLEPRAAVLLGGKAALGPNVEQQLRELVPPDS